MSWDDIKSGSVIRYHFLWNREAITGETEGRKQRETVVAARFELDGQDHIIVLPITSKEPAANVISFELPETEVRRLSRNDKSRLWVIIEEQNTDVIGRSMYLEPDCKVGDLSPIVFKQIFNVFVANFRSAKRVDRSS